MGVPVLVRRWRRRPLLRDAGDGHDLHGDVRAERCPGRPGGGVRLRCWVGVGCRRCVGSWKWGDGVGCGVELVRAVRVSAELRRCERLGDRGRCGVARSDVRDDGRGVGAAIEAGWVADGRGQGARGWRRLRARCRCGRGAAVGSGGHRRRAERGRFDGVAVERVDASRGHVRRGRRAVVRQRGAGGIAAVRRRDGGVDGPLRLGETVSGASGSRA